MHEHNWINHEVVFPFGISPTGRWVRWKASNRLIVQPQAHFPLLGEFASVWLPKAFVRLQQTHDGCWVLLFFGEEAIEQRLIGGEVVRMFLLTW